MNIIYKLIINSLYIHSQTYRHKSNGKGCREKFSTFSLHLYFDSLLTYYQWIILIYVEM